MHQKTQIKTFMDLNVWKHGHQLVLNVYRHAKRFPRDEIFGLTSQLKRASVSITSNIAEGFSRQSYKEKLQFYSISLGSLTEVQNQLLVARDVSYLPHDDYQSIYSQTVLVHRLLNGLIKKTKTIIHYS